MPTTTYTLPDLATTAGPYEAVTFRLGRAAPVQVNYVYKPALPDIPTLPNGDPGEPGEPEYFDFQQIMPLHPLVLTAPGTEARFLVPAGEDMHWMLDQAQLDAMEQTILRQIHDELDEHALSFMPRVMFLAVEDRP